MAPLVTPPKEGQMFNSIIRRTYTKKAVGFSVVLALVIGLIALAGDEIVTGSSSELVITLPDEVAKYCVAEVAQDTYKTYMFGGASDIHMGLGNYNTYNRFSIKLQNSPGSEVLMFGAENELDLEIRYHAIRSTEEIISETRDLFNWSRRQVSSKVWINLIQLDNPELVVRKINSIDDGYRFAEVLYSESISFEYAEKLSSFSEGDCFFLKSQIAQ